jgi:hypothetical protein
MDLDYEKLFEPYTRDGHTLENSVRYLRQTAATLGIDPQFVEMAMRVIFTRVADGHNYPMDKCPCGCGIDKAGTAITHAMRDEMIRLSKQDAQEYLKLVNRAEARLKPEQGFFSRVKGKLYGLVRRS